MKAKRFLKVWSICIILLCTLGICGCSYIEKKAEEMLKDTYEEIKQSGKTYENMEYEIQETTLIQEAEDDSLPYEQLKPAADVTVAELPDEPVRLPNDKKILLTGDSRTVCLYCSQIYDEIEYPKHIFYNIDENNYTGYTNECIVVAKGGEGYSWMQAIGTPYALSHIDEADAIVIWFGINDLERFADYINYVNSIAGQYDLPVYYMTVGPCNGKWEEKNNNVIAFNMALTQFLDPSVTIIDAYSYIYAGLESGMFATTDGLHYDYNTSKAIYGYMLEQIGK